MADFLPRILGFGFTDDKFLGNDRFIFRFSKARNMLLKRNKREKSGDQEEEKHHPSPLS